LRVLLDEFERFSGQRHGALTERLREPISDEAPSAPARLAATVLKRLWRQRSVAVVAPKLARATLFRAGALHRARSAAIAAASAELSITRDELLESLFGDLAAEKVMVPPRDAIGPAELALRVNLALVSGLLKRAVRVSIKAEGNTRALVRLAKLKGLICTVQAPSSARDAAELQISGPYALFRRTTVYGRALAALVPRALWCRRMELKAPCALRDDEPLRTLVVRSGDPILPAQELPAFDSRLEQRLARELGRLAPHWEIVREPEPIAADGTLIHPDFLLRHRHNPRRSWLVEIAGFWTPDYLADKLRRLRAARLPRFIICVDQARNCTQQELPPEAKLIRFNRRIDPLDVLRVIDPQALQLSLMEQAAARSNRGREPEARGLTLPKRHRLLELAADR